MSKKNSIAIYESTHKIGTNQTPGILDELTGIPVAVLGNKVKNLEIRLFINLIFLTSLPVDFLCAIYLIFDLKREYISYYSG